MKTAGQWRAWLQEHHETKQELWLVFYKKSTGKVSLTYENAIQEALCFGWIDGIRRRVDDEAYTIRFTPRRKGSVWSAVNVKLMAELEAAGKMTAAGRAIFMARPDPDHPGYSYETRDSELDAGRLRAFKKHKAAWKFYSSQAPSYQRTACHWVMSAKREETRDRRLAKLIEASEAGRRVY